MRPVSKAAEALRRGPTLMTDRCLYPIH